MRFCLVATVVLGGLATPLFAQGGRGAKVEECLLAIENGDTETASEIAQDIRGWRTIFATKLKLGARDCLEGATGDDWVYIDHLSRFGTSEEAAKLEAEAEARALARDELDSIRSDLNAALSALKPRYAQQRNRLIASDVFSSCVELFEEDRVAAMTNEVCVESFQANRHPSQEPFTSFALKNFALVIDDLPSEARERILNLDREQLERFCNMELSSICEVSIRAAGPQ